MVKAQRGAAVKVAERVLPASPELVRAVHRLIAHTCGKSAEEMGFDCLSVVGMGEAGKPLRLLIMVPVSPTSAGPS